MNVKQDEEFTISLESNPSTGYRWEPLFNRDLLHLVSEEFEEAEEVGSPGSSKFRFKALRQGSDIIKMSYKRSWEQEPIDYREFQVIITV